MFDHELLDSFVSFKVLLRDSLHFISIDFTKVCKIASLVKMEPTKYTIPILKQLLKERGVRGYAGKREAELIAMLQASDPQPQTWSHTLLDELRHHLPQHCLYHLGLREHQRKRLSG